MKNKQESAVYLKGYTVHQVEHEILGKYYQAYVGIIRALEHVTSENFSSAHNCLDWAGQNLKEVKQIFPDISEKASQFEEILTQARNALSVLEKKLESDPHKTNDLMK